MVEKRSIARAATIDLSTTSSGAASLAPRISDYYKWSVEQADHIRAGRFDKVDLLNVADEIEDVGKSEARELTSNLENILIHLLKWDQQPRRRGRSWILSIMEHRRRVSGNLGDSPSLAAKWAEIVDQAYPLARLRAARETGLALKRFPETCPYSREEIMDAAYAIDES